MKCEHCGKNEATFFYKSSVNGHVTQVHLCQDCAQAMGYTVGWDEATETVRLDQQVSGPAETPEDAPAE